MQGKRVYPENSERGVLDAQPGEYFKDTENGGWRGKTPNGLDMWLLKHHVEEHEDGTISVLPTKFGSNSILTKHMDKSWHGYIRKGVWEECK